MPQRESESLRLWQRCCASAALGVLAGQYSVAFETPELPAPASDSAEPLSCVLLTVGDHQVAWVSYLLLIKRHKAINSDLWPVANNYKVIQIPPDMLLDAAPI